jgi:ATP-dependent helicase HrpB
MQFSSSLPVTEILPQLLAAMDTHPAVILRAPPGAGKTTIVPLALLESSSSSMEIKSNRGKVIITQPRRLAARMTAARISTLHQSDLGSTIGYQVRMERRWHQGTRIIAMTTGVLLRRLLGDPFLEDFEVVILDEFHERALELDLVLGMLKRLQQTVRPDLKVLVMSATMECGPIAEFFDDAPVIESQGRCFDVSIRYQATTSLEKIESSVASILPKALSTTPGHLLVFLPGVGEIERTNRAVEKVVNACDFQILQLYGEMSPASQDLVLAPSTKRKIILATNVAETSLTIDGVTGVIDSGLVRVMRYHPNIGISRLVLEPNSLASANQRAGRAGRQAPGVCFRLWPESLNRTRSPFDTPEIHRTDLSAAILQLAGMGEDDWEAFPWLTPPKKNAVETAIGLLNGIGALKNNRITTEGHHLLRLPTSPRLAKLMIAALRLGIAKRGALAAALLSERDVFRNHRGPAQNQRMPNSGFQSHTRSDSDLVDRVGRIEAVLSGGDDPALSRGAVQTIERAANYLLRSLDEPLTQAEDSSSSSTQANSSTDSTRDHRNNRDFDGDLENDTRLRRAVGEAYLDRVARRRSNREERALMVGGIGVKLAPSSSVKDASLFVCVDVEQREGDSIVKLASAIDPEWLPDQQRKEVTEYFFNPTTRGVQSRRRVYWCDLVIEERSAPLADEDQVAKILFEEVKRQWETVFPANDPAIANFLARIHRVREAFPSEDWPEVSISDLHQIAAQLCRGKRDLEEVKRGAWSDFLLGLLNYPQQARLNELAPVDWTAPSGNRIRIDYGSYQPKISVRLQELFGLTDTPRLLGGRVVCLLELLGPNYRPQQLTSDLASFWQNTYPTVRKELLRRYPKHHWPEDPRSTSATRSGLKRDAK